MKEGVDQKHKQDEEDRHAHDEKPETVSPLLEGGGRGLGKKGVGNLTELRILPGAAHQHLGRAADHRCPQKHGIAGREDLGLSGQFTGSLFHRKRLAGQQGLVDEEVLGLQHPAITGNQVAGGKERHIPGHHFRERDLAEACPSRSTWPRTATDWRRRSAAWPARYSWTKSRVTLIRTMALMMKKLAASPVKAEMALATRRMITRGLRNLARNWSSSPFSLRVDQVGPEAGQSGSRLRTAQPIRAGIQAFHQRRERKFQNGAQLSEGAGMIELLQGWAGKFCSESHN